jgi:alpha-glucosidase
MRVRLAWATTLSLLAFFSTLRADYQFLGDVLSGEHAAQGMILHCSGGHILHVEFLQPGVFRVTLERSAETEPLLDYALVPLEFPPVQIQFTENTGSFALHTTELTLEIAKNPCRLTVRDTEGTIINQDDAGMGIGWDGPEVRCWKTITPDEKFLGLGLKSGDVNKRGREYVMWNADWPAYEWRTDPLYQSIPFFVGIRAGEAYGIYLNNSYRTHFNMGAGNARYSSFWAEQGRLDYFFIYGPHISDVVERYTDLTGRASMPPLWSLGYQQCRYSYFPDTEVLRIAETFREKQIPADVIYLDIHYMDGFRVFTWNSERFPNPKGMLQKLTGMGFHVVTIIDPGVKADSNYAVAREGLENGYFVRYPDGETYVGEVWPGRSYFPDFSKPQTRVWWGNHVGDWLAQGISGCWNDMNEPAVWGQAFPLETVFDDEGRISSHKKLHNLYGFLMVRATYEGALRKFPDKRPFVLTRAGFAGEQRYTSVWTGDNVASFDQLELGIRMLQGLSVSGVPFVGTDVGGFIGTPSRELFARWIQVGAFSPFFRTHTEYGSNEQEPWSFGENVEAIAKNFISLRYRLLPYFYSLFYEATQTGAPLIRPLCWSDQTDERAYDHAFQQQFFVGDKLMVAPVTREGQYLKEVYLPQGKWLDWNTQTVYDGGQTVIVHTPWEVLPTFLREGAIIPMQDVIQHTGETPPSRICVEVFPSSSEEGRFVLYEDDGESFDYRNGEYRTTEWVCRRSGKETQLSQTRPHDGYALRRVLEIHLRAFEHEPQSVTLNDKPLTEISHEAAGSGFFYDGDSHILTVRFPDDRAKWQMSVK